MRESSRDFARGFPFGRKRREDARRASRVDPLLLSLCWCHARAATRALTHTRAITVDRGIAILPIDPLASVDRPLNRPSSLLPRFRSRNERNALSLLLRLLACLSKREALSLSSDRETDREKGRERREEYTLPVHKDSSCVTLDYMGTRLSPVSRLARE